MASLRARDRLEAATSWAVPEGVAQVLHGMDDAAAVVDRLAASTGTPGALAALDAVSSAGNDLAHNVSPQLALEVMLLRIKEALACPPSFR